MADADLVTLALSLTELTSDIDNVRKLVWSVLIAALTAFALVLVPYAVIRLIRAGRTPQLVLDDLKDATAHSEIKDRLPGLSAVLREHVVDQLARLSQVAAHTLARSRLVGANLSKSPLTPRTTPDATAEALAASLKSLAPEAGGPVVQFLTHVLVRPRGTKVVGTIQRRGGARDRLGLSYAIANLRDTGMAAGVTFWEREALTAVPTTVSSPTSSDTRRTPIAPALRAAASRMQEVGLFHEAVVHLAEALKRLPPPDQSPEAAAAAAAASAAAVKFRLQSERRAAFVLAGKLEEAGQIRHAVAEYVIALPPDRQEEGRRLWERVLAAPTEKRSGPPLRALALHYRAASLCDEAYQLLKRARACGDREAAAAEASMSAKDCRSLVAAASTLVALLRFDAAKPLVERALGRCPDDEAARAVQAAILGGAPSKDDKAREAAARIALARIREKSGRLAEAEVDFAAAISAVPDHAEARAGLENLLKTRPTPDQRFADILRPAARVLALELLRRELIQQRVGRWWVRAGPVKLLELGVAGARDDDSRRDEGLIRNYIGMLLQASKGMPGFELEFLERAAREFESALLLIPDYYQPHENLADTYLFMAKARDRELRGCPPTPGLPVDGEVQDLTRRGIYGYHEAIRVLDRSELGPSPDGASARRLLQAGLAVALVLPGASRNITTACTTINSATARWNPRAETNARVLFNVAAAYGRLCAVGAQPPDNLVAAGRALLVRAMARDGYREYWSEVGADPDLSPLLTPDDAQKLKAKFQEGDRCLYGRRTGEFENAIQAVMDAMKWPPEPLVVVVQGGRA